MVERNQFDNCMELFSMNQRIQLAMKALSTSFFVKERLKHTKEMHHSQNRKLKELRSITEKLTLM